MKKTLTYGFVALMAAAAMTATVSDASAKPYWMVPHARMMPAHHHVHSLHFSTPFFFGFSFGPRLHPYRHFYRTSPHVQWCLSHYRTYNPATNLYFIKKGVPAVCISPFSY